MALCKHARAITDRAAMLHQLKMFALRRYLASETQEGALLRTAIFYSSVESQSLVKNDKQFFAHML